MMKRIPIYLMLILSCITIMSGCVDIQEFEEPVQKVSKVFYADMEENATTKTVLGAKDEDRTRAVLWSPEDKIGVVPVSGGSFDLFVNKNTEASSRAIFEGQTVLAQRYFAVYPYNESATVADGTISFTLSGEQVYKADSFDQNAFPMVARSSDINTDGLKFSNLCGLLEVNLTGEEKITKITFSSDKIVSGKFTVDTGYEEYPEIIPDVSGSTSATLKCGEGVQLNVDSPTPFYLVLPPGIYEKFTVIIQTSDGNVMFKQSKNPLNIKRSRTAYAGALEYVESTSIDLSLHGTSNSYVVSGPNMYCFNASVIGNGTYGIVPGASFHTEDPSIAPVSVEVLWETNATNIKAEKGYLLSEVSLKDGYVHFISTGEEGNALIAVKDADGKILWSWHIWMTDQPVDQTYINSTGIFVVQDRNLGATRADRGTGDEWKESIGNEYFKGRKDPFVGELFTSTNPVSTILESINSPTVTSVVSSDRKHGIWSQDYKTIYDPCPVGYMVASAYVWDGFSMNTTIGEFDNGWYFIYDGTHSTWYPTKSRGTESGTQYWNDSYMFHSTPFHPTMWGYPFYFSSSKVGSTSARTMEMHQVRCMKEEGLVDLAMPTVEMVGAKEATAESVTFSFNIKNEGASEVTDAGIIYGTTSGLSLANGTKVPRTGEENIVEVTGLSEGTKYYAVAYASNSYGTTYSKEIVFYTKFANYTNLSNNGSSNSYIVPPTYAAYTFDCTVKGNSSEPVGEAVSAEVIWETKNTKGIFNIGEIIPRVELLDGKVRFMLPFEPVQGNAMIAVKDASGKILWSWHIWVTDYDPETDADLYASGAKMMDRNLGAQNDNSRGFYYQWGRKDPFTHKDIAVTVPENIIEFIDNSDVVNNLEYAVSHPNHFIKSSSWNDDASLWDAIKTMYDPCPQGYRVPEKDMWTGWQSSGYIFPDTGCLEGGNPQNWMNSSYVFFWLTDKQCIKERSNLSGGNISDALPLRCMKDADIIPVTLGCSNITEECAILNGKLTINDNTVIEEMGFVVSKTSSDISVSNENCTKFIVDSTTGEFSIEATGLVPNTTYYYTAFAKGGYNIKYGEVMEFRTHSIGISDDFTGDDYVWE